MDNLEEMDKFLEKHNLMRPNQEEIENINSQINKIRNEKGEVTTRQKYKAS